MIDVSVSSVFWLILIALDILLALKLALMYRKDGDKRKLIFVIGLVFISHIYLISIYGTNGSALLQRVFEWCPLPLIAGFVFSIFNDRFETNSTKYYNIFLGIVALTIGLFFIPLPFPSGFILLPGVFFGIILAFHQYIKHFDLSSVILVLSMPSFGFCYVGIYYGLVELAIFSAFVSKAFMLLAFEEAKRQGIDSSPLVLRKKLENANTNFTILFNLLPDPALIIDSKGHFLEVTDGVTKLTGFSRDEFLGSNFLNVPLLSTKSKAIVVKNLAKRMMGLHIAPYEIEVLRKDGKKLLFELNASKIEYNGNKADLVLFRDLTERHRLIKSIEEKEERFRDVANNIGDWVWEVDQKGIFVYANSGVEQILGYTVEEIIGKKFKNFVSPEDQLKANEFFKLKVKQKQSYEFVERFVHRSGKIVVLETKGVPILDETEVVVGYRGVGRNITEKIEMQEKLLKSERLAAVGELATMVAHDLRNPLQSIATAMYCLEKTISSGDCEKTKKLVNSVKNSLSYSDKIVRELLDYSAKIKLEISQTTPSELITQVLSTISVPSNVTLFNETKGEPIVYLDLTRIRRVCVNIITNAFDAMPHGGTLTLSSRTVNENIELSFSDTGIGMTPEHVTKLMTPFFTTKAKGMGLGLAISKRIADAHDGTITVDSLIGQGTTFTLVLPLEPQPATSNLQNGTQELEQYSR